MDVAQPAPCWNLDNGYRNWQRLAGAGMSPLKWILSWSSTTTDSDSPSETSPLIRESKIEDGRVIGTPPSNATNDVDDESSSAEYEPIEGVDPDARTGVWQKYNEALERRPLLVKSMTAFVILGSGDLCGQGLEHLLGKSPSVAPALAMGIDWPRAARFGMFGLLGAPWAHYFYYFLDQGLPPTDKKLSWTTVIKVVIDQFVQAPALLALMISTISILKGTGVQGVREDLHRNYWTALVANWKLWMPFSFINMAFVKPTLRVLFVNAVFFGWTIILSMLINSS